MAELIKLTFTSTIPTDAKIITKDGAKWARFKVTHGFQECPLTDKGNRIRRESRCWYARWWNADRLKYEHKKLCANKDAAKVMLGELVKKLDRSAAGITDPFEAHRLRPVHEHVADFIRDLASRGRTEKHVAETEKRIKAIVNGCGFVFLGDISATRTQEYLADLRASKRPIVLPAQEWIRADEAAKLLRTSKAFLARQAERFGVARKVENRWAFFHRDGLLTLAVRKVKGKSARTLNASIIAFKSFVRWCVRDRRLADNPLGHLVGLNEATDRRHERRPLETEELRALFQATTASETTLHGLTGPDRLIVYAIAASTGLRASELASLKPIAFELDGNPATVRLAAEDAKNAHEAFQPLHPDLVEPLRDYLAGRDAYAVLWPGSWAEKAASMLRHDLKVAGIAYRDGKGHVADFHSLRVHFITALAKSGVHPRTAQELARHHSDINLTMRVYTKLEMRDLGGAVDGLPNLMPKAAIEAMKATGTEGVGRNSLESSLKVNRHNMAQHGENHRDGAGIDQDGRSGEKVRLAAKNAGNAGLSKRGKEFGVLGFEPRRTESESEDAIQIPRPGVAKDASADLLETGLKVNPELARIVNAWPSLSAEARQAILGVIDAHQPNRTST